MSEIQALGYLGLSVTNIAAWQDFGANVLGAMPVARADGDLDLRIDAYAHRIRLHQSDGDDLAYLGWEVADRAALDGLASVLGQLGTDVIWADAADARDRHCEALFRFSDPDGFAHEVMFGPLQLSDQPFHSPRAIKGFKTGSQGLGHVVINTAKPQELEAFYRDVLGFKVSDYIHAELAPGITLDLVFMRCNSRHHSIAITSAPIPQRLQHFMLELNELDDVGSTYYLAQQTQVPLALSLGRHSNDQMLSFYMLSPSMIAVEYGWGGLEVDDNSWHVQSHKVPSSWGHEMQMPPPGVEL